MRMRVSGTLAAAAVLISMSQAPAATAPAQRCLDRRADGAVEACAALIGDGSGWSARSLARLYVARGAARASAVDDSGAVRDYDRAIAADPTYHAAYAARGIAQKLDVVGIQRMLDDGETAVRLKPEAADGWRVRAFGHLVMGDATAAMRDLDAALACEDDGRVRMLRASALLRLGEPGRAREEIDVALATAPPGTNAGFALTQRAQADILLGRNADAAADLDRALAEDPEDGSALQMRGLLRYYAGDYRGAHADLSAASRRSPEEYSPAIWTELAGRRIGAGGGLAEAAKKFETVPGEVFGDRWPHDLVDLLEGRRSARDALKDADAYRRSPAARLAHFMTDTVGRVYFPRTREARHLEIDRGSGQRMCRILTLEAEILRSKGDGAGAEGVFSVAKGVCARDPEYDRLAVALAAVASGRKD